MMNAEQLFLERLFGLKEKSTICDPLETPISIVKDDPCDAETIEELEGIANIDDPQIPLQPTLAQLSSVVKTLSTDLYDMMNKVRGHNSDTLQDVIKHPIDKTLSEIRAIVKTAAEDSQRARQDSENALKQNNITTERLLVMESQMSSLLQVSETTTTSLKELQARLLRIEATHTATACGCSALQRASRSQSDSISTLVAKQSVTETILKLTNPFTDDEESDVHKKRRLKHEESLRKLSKLTAQLQQSMHRRSEEEVKIFCDDEKRMSSVWSSYDNIRDCIKVGEIANTFPELVPDPGGSNEDVVRSTQPVQPPFDLNTSNTESHTGYLPKQYKSFSFTTPPAAESDHTRSPSSSPKPPFDLSADNQPTVKSYTPKQHKKLSLSVETDEQTSCDVVEEVKEKKEVEESKKPSQDDWQTSQSGWQTASDGWNVGGEQTQWEKFPKNEDPPEGNEAANASEEALTFDTDDDPDDDDSGSDNDLPGY
eukprot:TRINITY_DN7467_c0_g3_i1.p1 TRINITY_DN7467_c0_g3~~TRINITY_DN7467_c0_g3_i1.p1  ORF type:complete len:484 (+),score=117.93 TRINITY_DN7467_c0_g3_i1:238-1689(+)